MADNDLSQDNPAFARQRAAQSRAQLFSQPVSTDNPALARQQATQQRAAAQNVPVESRALGAITGGVAGSSIAAAQAVKQAYDTAKSYIPQAKAAAQNLIAEAADKMHGGEKWANKLTGVELPGAQMEKASLDTAQRMAAAIAPGGGEFAGGTIQNGIILPPSRTVAQPAAAAEGPLEAMATKFAPTAGKAISAISKYGVAPILSLASSGEQGMDAVNRYNQGDTTGAIVSGLGAIGDAATMRYPRIGIPVSLGARAINYARDNPQILTPTYSDALSTSGYARGGLVGIK